MNKYILKTFIFYCTFVTFAHSEADFPMPQEIAANVKLWTNVYSRWGSQQAAIFDRNDMSIIYAIISLPKYNERSFGLNQEQIIKAAVQEIKDILHDFAALPPESEKGLWGYELDVFNALKNNHSPNKYERWDTVGYMQGMRERFEEAYRLSGAHSKHIEKRLTDNDLPKELLGLVFVESMFLNHARSKAGACGLWQLLRGTAKENIHVNKLVDERFDPILATEAAIDYLKSAYKKFRSWPLTITSYNYGRAGMQRALDAASTSSYAELVKNCQAPRFGFAARNYYPEFLAALQVYQNGERLFSGMSKEKAWNYDVYTLPFPIYFRSLASLSPLKDSLIRYNPALTREAKNGLEVLPEGFKLRIPLGTHTLITNHLKKVHPAEKKRAATHIRAKHRATGKQSIKQIAHEHDISHEYLADRLGTAAHSKPARGKLILLRSAGSQFSKLPAP